MHVQNLIFAFFLGLVPKESHCTIIIISRPQKFTQLALQALGLHTQPCRKERMCHVPYLQHFTNKNNVTAYG